MLHNFTLALLFNGRCHWEAVTSFPLKPAFPHLLSWKLLTRLDEKRASTQERCGTISTQAYSVVSFWFLYLGNLLFSRLQDVTSWLDGLYIGNSFFLFPTTAVRVQPQIKAYLAQLCICQKCNLKLMHFNWEVKLCCSHRCWLPMALVKSQWKHTSFAFFWTLFFDLEFQNAMWRKQVNKNFGKDKNIAKTVQVHYTARRELLSVFCNEYSCAVYIQ